MEKRTEIQHRLFAGLIYGLLSIGGIPAIMQIPHLTQSPTSKLIETMAGIWVLATTMVLMIIGSETMLNLKLKYNQLTIKSQNQVKLTTFIIFCLTMLLTGAYITIKYLI